MYHRIEKGGVVSGEQRRDIQRDGRGMYNLKKKNKNTERHNEPICMHVFIIYLK